MYPYLPPTYDIRFYISLNINFLLMPLLCVFYLYFFSCKDVF